MKYLKTKNQYKAANVMLDMDNLTAYSYNWWKFVARINGLVVFNTYRYSNSTCKHQRKVFDQLAALGIYPDVCIHAPKGLQNLDSALAETERQIVAIQEQINKPRSHARVNEERKAQIRGLELDIQHIMALKESTQQQLAA